MNAAHRKRLQSAFRPRPVCDTIGCTKKIMITNRSERDDSRMAQRKTYLQKREKDGVNKKAIAWAGGIALAVIAAMTVLLILDK
ncbi:hypothetical protein SD70_31745 [Gordoniibacillus kamchatkensis]|uniref:Uncharacterized protein n=1 Tax=Gordoniibacillus kamchatkensis TaxID=1590651 RepID=A0ABR5A668_9BACL|nr:hypothetical protein SD70_31745 [Paenibacillus sp. VKM B-2647]